MFLWFYYYKHTTALPHPGNPGLCVLYLPSLLYLDQARHKCPSFMSARETFDRAVQLIAYNDTISPAVKELYKNCARTPHDAGLLIHVLGAPPTSAPFSRALGIGRKFRVWERSFLEVTVRQ